MCQRYHTNHDKCVAGLTDMTYRFCKVIGTANQRVITYQLFSVLEVGRIAVIITDNQGLVTLRIARNLELG